MRLICFAIIFLLNHSALAQSSSNEIYHELLKFGTNGKVLYIAAHPDDENTQLLSYLSNDRRYETAYLSITRGDGGQNLIGTEQGEVLGLIRTHELLAARKVDRAQQFFTRAKDFGFSKSAAEALSLWPDSIVLADVVKVIRLFQPDIIITRFPDDSRAGHGHHEASAILAKRAFVAAADPAAFPEQLNETIRPWKTKRLLWNTFRFSGANTIDSTQFNIVVGQLNPLLGKNSGELSAQSRSQHKSQGFGVAASHGLQTEYFVLWDGEPFTADIMEGVATQWLPAKQQKKLQEIIRKFNISNPAQSLSQLVSLKNELSKANAFHLRQDKLIALDRIIFNTAGIYADAYTTRQNWFQDDSLNIQLRLYARNNSLIPVTVRWLDQTLFRINIYSKEKSLMADRETPFEMAVRVPAEALQKFTVPYWMANPSNPYYFSVPSEAFQGKPVDQSDHTLTLTLVIEGVLFDYNMPVQYKYVDPVKGELYEPVQVLPVLQVRPLKEKIFRSLAAETTAVEVELIAEKSFSYDSVRIDWNRPDLLESQTLSAGVFSERSTLKVPFSLKQWPAENTELYPRMTIWYNNVQSVVEGFYAQKNYDHIPRLQWREMKGVRLITDDFKITPSRIGYIQGAGDLVSQQLREVGYQVDELSPSQITAALLQQYDVVILGIRALNVESSLLLKNDLFNEYVKNGGNLIVQYNTNNQLAGSGLNKPFGPFPYAITRSRVVDENSPVQINLPEHAILNYPNKITLKDFNGWVQERGLYFAEKTAPEYQMPISFKDAEEEFHGGGLIIAPYGKGHFVYTGIAFFRQLPAGVPGAFKLFANMIAL